MSAVHGVASRSGRRGLVALGIFVACALAATTPIHAADLRGIYVYSGDVAQISKGSANNVTASLGVTGVDGIVLVISWSSIEPAMGQYQWTTLDLWTHRALALGKKIDLTITAGTDIPAWLFQPAPSGAGASPLNFTISPHSGATGVCDAETIAAPWDTAFLNRWDLLLAAVSAHLKVDGTYTSVTLLRLTGVNRTDATFLAMLETGIFPLGRNNSLRAQYIEIFPANANAFPGAVFQAHDELIALQRRRAARH